MRIKKTLSPKLKAVGDRIRANRKRCHFTQQKVAEALGTDSSMISRYENGKVDIPVSILLRIAELCGFEPKSCFSWRSDGLNELQKLLEDCAALDGQQRWDQPIEAQVSLSDKEKDLVMAYSTLRESEAISRNALKSIGEEITKHIEFTQDDSRNNLLRRIEMHSGKTDAG